MSISQRIVRQVPEPVVVETPPPPSLGPPGLTLRQLRRIAMERARSLRGEAPEGVDEETHRQRRRLVTASGPDWET